MFGGPRLHNWRFRAEPPTAETPPETTPLPPHILGGETETSSFLGNHQLWALCSSLGAELTGRSGGGAESRRGAAGTILWWPP